MVGEIDRAMVLAAGFGTRMRPLTQHLPKPLLRVAGKTLLDYNLDQLAAAGVKQVCLNQHYLPELITAHIAARAKSAALPQVTLSWEKEEMLDSGGGIANVIDFFVHKPFFSLNADTIWLDGVEPNLRRMNAFFKPEKMDALLLLAPTVSSLGWENKGDFFMDQEGRLSRPHMQKIAPFAYTGAAILQPQCFAHRPRIFSLNEIFNESAAQGRLFGLRMDGVFMHVGTPQALAEAEAFFKRWQQ